MKTNHSYDEVGRLMRWLYPGHDSAIYGFAKDSWWGGQGYVSGQIYPVAEIPAR